MHSRSKRMNCSFWIQITKHSVTPRLKTSRTCLEPAEDSHSA